MKLRSVLCPITVSQSTKDALAEHILLIERSIQENSPRVLFYIRTFSAFTGRDYDYTWFKSFRDTVTIEEFVAEASQPPPKRYADITTEELIEIVRRALPGDESFEAEHASFYVELFEANVNMRNAGDLLYFPPPWKSQNMAWNPTPEEIVEIALSFLPESAYIAI